MNPSRITKLKREWDELEALVKRARKSISRLSPAELSRLDVLYRRTSAHLAQTASRTSDRALIQYLNDLTASAHSIIYLPPRRRISMARIAQIFTEDFPRSIARLWKFHLASLLLMLLGIFVAFISVSSDPSAAYALMPAGETRQPGATQEQLLEALRSGRDQAHGEKFHFASFLFSHNLKVGITSMATGFLAGIPTVLLLVYNGMVLGAFASIHYRAGITAEMWAWILPHGITELTAIILCGGVGLRIGQAVLSPGFMTRSDSMRLAGRQATFTVIGVAAMLFLAAAIESYLRQSHLSQSARFTFAAASFVCLAIYFTYGYRLERSARETAIPSAP